LKALIAFYSKTGNTGTVSNAIKKALESNCEVDVLRIEMVREYSNCMLHINPRVLLDVALSRRPRIKPLGSLGSYDLICIGTPNWYGRTAPPVRTFIEELTNVDGKRAIGFVTSGFGKESYADELRRRLERKGLRVVKALSLTLGQMSELQQKEIAKIISSRDNMGPNTII
jgi:flavodoxin